MKRPLLDAPADLREALLGAAPLIDLRAPVEFAQGALPRAENLPLLDDAQRAAVGLRYRREGAEAAMALGRALVSGDDLAQKTRALLARVSADPRTTLYCFRGGLRSQSVGASLRAHGHAAPVLAGGYKRARRFLIDATETLSAAESFVAIGGFTGCGKTVFLQRLAQRRRAIDLEGLAHHRGSAFGQMTTAQPSQVDFENRLAVALWRENEREDRDGPIALEDESRMIGRAELPAAIFQRLSTAPLYVIEKSNAERARFLIQVYSENYALQDGAPPTDEAGRRELARLKAELMRALTAIERRLGGAATRELMQEATEALAIQERTGAFAPHAAWIERLLALYYDPLYCRHLEANASRVAFQGPEDAVLAELEKLARGP